MRQVFALPEATDVTSERPKKLRLDDELVRRGLSETVKSAQSRILAGDVILNDQRVDKAGTLVTADASIRVKDEGRFVSRGGDKLAAALEDFGLSAQLSGKTVLDVGASTGGFTDCCLQHGAKFVFAVDVGTNQLAWSLRQDSRVQSFEKTDVRDLKLPDGVTIDWVVADVSFTSLARLIPEITKVAPNSKMILLVKPQFELPRDLVPKGGVVENDGDRSLAITLVEEALTLEGATVHGKKDARVEGRAGNREIFIYASLSRV